MMTNYTQCAVLVPVYRCPKGEAKIVLILRSEGLVHGGQLAFPGGKLEPSDESLLATALRETEEETGLLPASVEILERLPEQETLSTGFMITPFLARIDPPPAWRYEAGEVDKVLDVPLDLLARPGSQGQSLETLSSGSEPRMVTWYQVDHHRLWGASYRILYPLLPRLLAGEWEL
ncbi:MAG: CoA pyrophosphatase [Gammaproteobacteria bacterium]|nr:CoA pyrophosphatase [Gammaproteobacteria bacterium]